MIVSLGHRGVPVFAKRLLSWSSTFLLVLVVFVWSIVLESVAVAQALEDGQYQGVIDTPGGGVQFSLRIQTVDGVQKTKVGDGEGAWEISQTEWKAPRVRFVIPEYDAGIDAELGEDGIFRGTYRRTRGKGLEASLAFRMVRKNISLSGVDSGNDDGRDYDGRWRLVFSDSDEPAVAVFKAVEGRVFGTVLTTTGDYRYLSGEVDSQSGELRLSAFDGGHVFLLKGRVDTDNNLVGKFWSGDWYEVGWKAVRDADARLPSGFGMSRVRESASLSDLEFPDLTGRRRKLDSPDLLGQVTIIELFGSWCPNCHDAAVMLGDFERTYRERGLKIVGLAFELTGDPERDRVQVERYVEHHKVRYPVLIAGVSDKTLASQAFPLLDRIRAYPSFLFVDQHGQVVATYTGFSGPATGEAHQRLREQFTERIEQLLGQ